MYSMRATPNARRIAALIASGAILVGATDALAQRGTSDAAQRAAQQFSGQMLPLQPMPPGMQPAIGALTNRLRTAVCNPPQGTGGPGPTAFYDANTGWPSFSWEAVPGAVAYQVERAVDGTNNWVLAGSTCGSPDAIREDLSTGRPYIVFQDIAGGLRSGETYVYKVNAIGAKGEVGWNSVRWNASSALEPRFETVVIAGSTVTLTMSLLAGYTLGGCVSSSTPLEVAVTAAYGLNRNVTLGTACSPLLPQVVVYGVPIGTHTFTASAHWLQSLDPAMPRVMLTTSRDTVITIKP